MLHRRGIHHIVAKSVTDGFTAGDCHIAGGFRTRRMAFSPSNKISMTRAAGRYPDPGYMIWQHNQPQCARCQLQPADIAAYQVGIFLCQLGAGSICGLPPTQTRAAQKPSITPPVRDLAIV